MKNIKIILAICIACIACETKQDGSGFKFVSHFTLDDISTVNDANNHSKPASIQSYNSSPADYTLSPDGKVGACYKLNGNCAFVCDSNLFYNFQLEYRNFNKYSVSFWFKVNDLTGTDVKYFFRSTLTYEYNCGDGRYTDNGLAIRNDTLMAVITDNQIFFRRKIYTPIPCNLLEWNQITEVVDSGEYKLYVNGVKLNYYPPKRCFDAKNSYLSDIHIGNRSGSGIYMLLDDVLVYNYPVTEAEVLKYYNSTK